MVSSRPRLRISAASACVLVLWAGTAHAATDDPQELKYQASTALPIIGGAVASVVLPGKATPACRWCDRANPNVVDRWARNATWTDPCRAAAMSYKSLAVAGVVAFVPLSRETRGEDWLVNAGAIVDSVGVTVMIMQAAKYTVRRERPAPSTCHPKHITDGNLSFFSGHTAVAFALVSSAYEVSRLRGHERSEWLWLGGAAAGVTGYLRMAGERHNLTDVIAGAGVGYLVGRWVPRHLHRKSPLESQPARVAASSPMMMGFTKGLASGALLQIGKGPGKSVQFGLTF